MTTKDSKLKTLAVALLLLTAAVIPLTQDGETDAAEIFAEYGDDQEYGSGLLAAAAILIGLSAAFGTGFVIGYYASPLHPDGEPGGDQDKIYREARTSEAGKLIGMADTAKSIITTVLPQDINLWFFTTDSWQKTIEYCVSDSWSMFNGNPIPYADVQYDMQVYSGLPNNSANYLYTWQAAIDNAYNTCLGYSVAVGQEPYGEDMVLSFDAGSGINISQGANPSNPMTFDLTQYVNPSSDQFVYIDTTMFSDDEKDFTKTMYNLGSSNVSITATSGTQITLHPGANDITAITNFASGVYKIPAGAKIAGPLIPLGNTSGSTTSATVSACLVLKNQSSLTYVLPNSDDKLNVIQGNYTTTVSSLSMHLDYEGRTGEGAVNPTDSVILGENVNIVGLYDRLIKQITNVANATAEAGKAQWLIFDQCEEKNQFIKPSSIVINIPGQTITAEESVALYIQALQQIAEYGKTNDTELKSFQPNADSMGLICYGDIYYNGILWAKDVVFTPYTTTANNTILTNQSSPVKWNGAGFAMVWAQVDNFNEWDGQTSSSDYRLLDLNDKYSIDVRTMKEKVGSSMVNITSKVLNKPTIEKSNTGGADPSDPIHGDNLKVVDANILLCILLIELGIILMFIGRDTGLVLIQVAGVIVILVGLMFPQIVTSLILGNFDWGDLLPFSWLKY